MGKVLKGPMSMFGIGQEDDPTFNPEQDQARRAGDKARMGSDRRMNEAMQNYASGKMGFEEALNQDKTARPGEFTMNDSQIAEMRDRLATGATTGSRYASEQVRSDPMSSGLFGEGGLQDRLGTEEKDLASRGYGLQGSDREAYGQAAGDISRQFGQQEQDVSKMLAKRGLGGGSSGAAGAAFSGLAGSKNEMLARAQTDIAQKRMQDTTQRLQATRNMMGTLGAQGQQAIQNQFGRQMAGRDQTFQQENANVKNEMGMNEQGRQRNEDAIGHKSKNIGDAWSEGKYAGTKSGEADATSSWMKMGGSGMMGMSDENNKTGVTDGGSKVRGFLSEVSNSQDLDAAPASGGGERKKQGGGMDIMSLFGGGSEGGGESAGGAGGLMSMFSDENCKTHVGDGSDEVRGFLDSVEPHSYEYKDEYQDNPLAGEGEFVSPMAQELEQTELGADMVQDTPDGKVVDYGKGFGTLLAGVADINKRLSRIEGRK